ncbi:hypothetical protein BCR44DRAFT_36078 [Catenaria anguillulae PL171]|uniref:Tetratricopeptide repeat protein 21A/21B C-terminal ARM domain-containing protein n=1 Tax=Catenaria anguillulae PL171 TaxID=765915 RepID=A0A1Y2I0H9_9FUNG|nr:hypothetical protein BCR44DRAFT_36078 [Catenaria anguillulae PL171]
MILYGSRKRADVEKGMAQLRDVDGVPSHHVPTLVAMAIGHHLLGNAGKAKSALKQVAAHEWEMVDASWIEAGWLMLARQYLEAGKEDAANALVKSCLEVNPHGGGVRAHAVYAAVAERAGRRAEAAKHWKHAWIECGKTDPHIGARLALALLGDNQPWAAIPVVQRALAQLHKQAGATMAADEDPVVHVPVSAIPPTLAGGGGKGLMAESGGGGLAGNVSVRLKGDVLDRARAALRP